MNKWWFLSNRPFPNRDIFLDFTWTQRKTADNLRQDSRCPHRDSNRELPEYVRNVTAAPMCSVPLIRNREVQREKWSLAAWCSHQIRFIRYYMGLTIMTTPSDASHILQNTERRLKTSSWSTTFISQHESSSRYNRAPWYNGVSVLNSGNTSFESPSKHQITVWGFCGSSQYFLP
jgi:hypothetical protein